MLKRRIIRKLIVTSAAVFALFLLYLVPKGEEEIKYEQKLEYVMSDVTFDSIYLLDKNNMLAKTKIVLKETSIEQKAKMLIEALIKDGKNESKIPNGFKSILPSDTKILSIALENDLLKINFSKELLDITEEMEEKMIEAIIYTLTSIPEIKQIIIYVEGDILTKLPQSKINLPSTLDRSFGINKQTDITSVKDINQTTVFYINQFNDDVYYVPVTKYSNNDKEKVKIIIDELTSSIVSNSNLMSFLNSNTKLLNVETNDDVMNLTFNNYIFSDALENEILEEVIYTICLSIKENYDVKEVVIHVNNQEIYKSVLKSLE